MPDQHNQFTLWSEAAQKFDYFMAGLTGALIAFVGQSFSPQRLGWNASTLELLALLLLIAAFWCAFKRIETFTDYLRLMLQRNKSEEWAIQLRQTVDTPVGQDLQTGNPLTNDEKAALSDKHMRSANAADDKLKFKGDKASGYYKGRNYLLIAGFLLLIISRVLAAYVCDVH